MSECLCVLLLFENVDGVICIGHKYLCLLFGKEVGILTSLTCAGNLLFDVGRRWELNVRRLVVCGIVDIHTAK